MRLQHLVGGVVVPLDGEQVEQGGDGLTFGLLEPFRLAWEGLWLAADGAGGGGGCLPIMLVLFVVERV